MDYLTPLLTVAVIHLLALVSPGPDLFMVMRNSLVYSRRSGIYSAIGIGLAGSVHVAYCLAGLGLVISQSVVAFSIIKYLGAAYLMYVGYKALRAKPVQIEPDGEDGQPDMTKFQALRSGFLTNVTNPKATLFFLGVFTLVIKPDTPMTLQLIMGAEMMTVATVWFCLVATLVSHQSVKRRLQKVQHRIERVMGAVLIAFGIKLATTAHR